MTKSWKIKLFEKRVCDVGVKKFISEDLYDTVKLFMRALTGFRVKKDASLTYTLFTAARLAVYLELIRQMNREQFDTFFKEHIERLRVEGGTDDVD